MNKINTLSQKLVSQAFISLFLILILGIASQSVDARSRDHGVAPVVTITSQQDGTIVPVGTPITFSATAKDDNDGDLSENIRWRSRTDKYLGKGSSITVTLSPGTHKIVAKVRNSNRYKARDIITVTVADVENSAPELTITSPSSNARFAPEATTQLSAMAKDAEDGDLSANIQWKSNIDGTLGSGASLQPKLSVGTHNISASVSDSAGMSKQASVILIIEKPEDMAPSIVIQSPGNGSNFTSDDNISFSATANDQEDGNLNAAIQWRSSVDGNLGSGASVSTSLSAANHVITATVTDSAGQSKDHSVNVLVAKPVDLPPSVTIQSPGNNAQFNSDALITFSAAANDPEDGNLSTSIQWHSNLDGNLGIGATISAKLSAANHIVTATIIDSANQSKQANVNVLVSDPVDLPPSLTIQSPTAGSSFETDASIAFHATASDKEDGNLSASIEWHSSIDGNLGKGANITANLSAANHLITAKITDSANQSKYANVNIVVAKPVDLPPSLAIQSPSNNSSYETDANITFTASANDEEDGNLSSKIQWHSSVDGNLGNGASVTAKLSAASHMVTAKVTDSAGQSKYANVSLTVSEPENLPPTVAILSPNQGASFDTDTQVAFNASAEDKEEGDLSQNILWHSSVDGNLGQGASLSARLSEGNHNITATIKDSANQQDVASVSVSVTKPEDLPPSVSIQSPGQGTSFEEDTTINFTANASDKEDGNLGQAIQWRSNKDGSLGTGTSINAKLSVGSHAITVTVSDSAGQQSSDTTSLQVTEKENLAPEIALVAPGNNANFDTDSNITFIANANDAEDGDLGAAIQWHSSIDGGMGSGKNLTTKLSAGNHIITASVKDSGDLTNQVSLNLTVEEVEEETFGSATISWNPPLENTDGSALTDLSGYKIYFGTSANNLNESLTVDDEHMYSQEITDLMSNTTYYFAVTAFNSEGVESDQSDVKSKHIN